MRNDVLHAVGYWNHDAWPFPIPKAGFVQLTAGFPHPPRLIEALGPMPADDRVLRYLRSGSIRATCMGSSYCRFGCESRQGSTCLTDGDWVWPAGLAHYVEVHQVPLPDEFLAAMQRNQWQVPRPQWSLFAPRRKPWDSIFWITWTARVLGS
jgi:hypothetical protein